MKTVAALSTPSEPSVPGTPSSVVSSVPDARKRTRGSTATSKATVRKRKPVARDELDEDMEVACDATVIEFADDLVAGDEENDDNELVEDEDIEGLDEGIDDSIESYSEDEEDVKMTLITTLHPQTVCYDDVFTGLTWGRSHSNE